MSRNIDHHRDGAPSIAEIAALTARLRELSTPGRAVDPAERAAFLADKDALLARITDPHHDPGRAFTAGEGAPGREVHSHRARTATPKATGDDDAEARREQLARWHHDATTEQDNTVSTDDDGTDDAGTVDTCGGPGWDR